MEQAARHIINCIKYLVSKNLFSHYLSIIICLFTFFCYIGSCSHISNSEKNEKKVSDLVILVAQADSVYAISPRVSHSVQKAFMLMSEVIKNSSDANPMRYEYLCKAARFANWLSYNGKGKMEISKMASEAMNLAQKAVIVNKDRVEGYYYHAIATGLFAEQNKIQSKDAMQKIRNDALKAISIDPTYDYAGPHRLLGALYLRAPGPPAGIGSNRKALHYLQKARAISPDYPENLIFLVEVLIKTDQQKAARELINKVLSSSWSNGDFMDRRKWQERALELKRAMEKSN